MSDKIITIFSDLAALRLSPDDLGGGVTSEILATVPVRRPCRQEFFRIHPNPEQSLTTSVSSVPESDEPVYR